MYREHLVKKLAIMLSGYDEESWAKLSTRTRRTYGRAAYVVLSNWAGIYTLLLQLPDDDKFKPQPQVKPSSS